MVLTKKTYSTTKKVFIYGAGSLLTLLTMLAGFYALGISVETSGDIVCGDTCVSYFNITITNYSLCFGSTFKGITLENATYDLYKADLRYSRVNELRWKNYTFSANTCLDKGKKYEFKLVGHKQPEDTVKWGLSLQGQDVDPYWEGLLSKNYDALTKTIKLSNSSSELMSMKLIENSEMCSNDCYAIIEINNSKELKLSDKYTSDFSWEFTNLFDNSIKNITHSFEISTSTKKVQIVDGESCREVNDINPDNKSKTTICEQLYKEVDVPDFKEFNYKNNNLPKGDFLLKLNGVKGYNEEIEWVPTILGNRIDEWTKWGVVNSFSNWTFDDSTMANTGIGNMTVTPVKIAGTVNYENAVDGLGINVTETYMNLTYPITTGQFTKGSCAIWWKPSMDSNLDTSGTFLASGLGGTATGRFGLGISLGTTGTISSAFGNGGERKTETTITNFSKGNWVFAVYKMNQTGGYIYINGTLNVKAEFSGAAFFGYTGKVDFLGISGAQQVSGLFDEFKCFFGTELTEAQILDMYNTENPTGDITAPVINMTYPTNVTYNAIIRALNYTVSDLNIQSCWYSNDSGRFNSTSFACGGNVTGINSSQGTNVFTIYANDTSNNINKSRVYFSVDSLAPNVNMTYPQNKTYNYKPVQLNYTVNETNLANCWWTNNSGRTNISIGCGTNITARLCYQETANISTYCGGLNTGLYKGLTTSEYININYTKPYNSLSSSTWEVLQGDNETIVNLSVASCWSAYSTKLALRLFSNSTNMSTYTIRESDAQCYNGSNWLSLHPYFSNGTDVLSSVGRFDKAIDGDWETYSFFGVSTFWANTRSQFTEINGSLLVEEAMIWNISAPFADEGTNKWIIYANDTIRNINKSTTYFSVDSILPNINIIYPTTGTNTTNTKIDVNYTTSDTNLQKCRYSNNSGLTNSSAFACGTNLTKITWLEGVHNVTIWVNDTINNINSSSVNFRIDTKPPYFTHKVNNYELAKGASFAEQFNATDDGVGLQSYSINDTVNFEINQSGYFDNKSALSIAIYRINISVNDTLGNKNSSVFYINVSDILPPNINMTFPANTSYNYVVTALNYTANDDTALGACKYSLNGGITNTTITCGNNVTGLTSVQGNNTWTIYANDTKGNSNKSAISFFIDSLKPNINMTFPSNASYNYLINVLNYTSNDTNLESCWYSNDSGLFNSTSFACGTNITGINTTEGTNVFTIWANDTLNNINYSRVYFSMDTIAPSINLTYPVNRTYNFASKPTSLQYTSSDVNLQKCWWTNNSGITNHTLTCGANASGMVVDEGGNKWIIYANDTYGNVNSSSVNFVLDTINPSINMTYPANITYSSLYIKALNYTIGDATLQNCWYSIDNGLTNTSLTCGDNVTGLVSGYGNQTWQVSANDSAGNENTSRNMFFVSGIVNNTFNYQDLDITFSNAFGRGVNISYNISAIPYLRQDTVQLVYKTNDSKKDYSVFVNGKTWFTGFISSLNTSIGNTMRVNVSDRYKFTIEDNEIYPATYNYPEDDMENGSKTNYTLSSQTQLIKERFYNVSDSKNVSFLEFWAQNLSVTSGSLRIYYCNETYVNGIITSDGNCVNFFTMPASQTLNHTHTLNSRHYIVPFNINTTSRQIGNVIVTNTSYFAFRGATIGNWNIKYLNNTFSNDIVQTTSNTGNTWNYLMTGIVDSHLHQFDGTDTFWYYACANNTYQVMNCTGVRQDLLEPGGMTITSPSVYNPISSVYEQNVTINYTAAQTSPESFPIMFYNITLVDVNENYHTFNLTIQTNNSLNLGYSWNSTIAGDGQYKIRVEATDTGGQTSRSYSENFTIDRTNPNVTLMAPSNGVALLSGNVKFTCKVNDTSLMNTTLYIQNNSGYFITQLNSTTSSSEINVTFNISLGIDSYNWTCRACDFLSHCDWGRINGLIVNNTLSLDVNVSLSTGISRIRFLPNASTQMCVSPVNQTSIKGLFTINNTFSHRTLTYLKLNDSRTDINISCGITRYCNLSTNLTTSYTLFTNQTAYNTSYLWCWANYVNVTPISWFPQFTFKGEVA